MCHSKVALSIDQRDVSQSSGIEWSLEQCDVSQ